MPPSPVVLERSSRLPFPAEAVFAWHERPGAFERRMHLHRFAPDGAAACVVTDRIEYVPPLGAVGAAADPLLIRPRLERMLAYRHELLTGDLEFHARYADRPRLRMAVTGAGGLIGQALIPFLSTGGHELIRVVRGQARRGEVAWNYELGRVDAAGLEGLDAVVHLAGENIAARWTEGRRR